MKRAAQRRPKNNGCLIAALVGLVAMCLIGVAVGAAAFIMYFYYSPVAANLSTSQPGEPTEIALAATATVTPGATPTHGVSPTLTTIPTNTLPAQSPLTPTLLSTFTTNLTATPSAKPTWMPCPGIYYSRLYVGDKATRQLRPALAQPGAQPTQHAGTHLGMLQPGDKAEIIGGPVCSNQWIWWQVRSLASDLTGWTAEGDNKAYWLVPAP